MIMKQCVTFSKLLRSSPFPKADGKFHYVKNGQDCFCVQGLALLYSGHDPRNKDQDDHSLISKALAFFGIKNESKNNFKCPVKGCGKTSSKFGYLLAHLQNSSGHNWSFKKVADYLEKLGY